MAAQREFTQSVRWLERALAIAAGSDERAEIAATLAEIARAAEAAGDGETAQGALELATRTVEWADLWCQLGCLKVNRGRRAEARTAFDRALALNPRYRTAVVERALLDAREGRIAEAMQTLRALAADGVLEEPGTFQQGMERLGHAEFEDAAPLLRRALQDGDAWLEEELRHYQERLYAGDLDGGLELLRAASAKRPGYPDLQLLLGAHERQMGAYDDAIESLTRALELNPDYHAARVELARTLESQGDTAQAVNQLDLVLAADAGHADARTLHDRLTARHLGSRSQFTNR
jgi:protein O-GlcNAc transferase